MEWNEEMTYDKMREFLYELSARFPEMTMGSIGESILGRSLPFLAIGKGEAASLFVGTHHSAESITASMLLRFAEMILENDRSGQKLCGFDVRQILTHRTLYLIPMLNPDGVAIRLGGEKEAGLFAKRVLNMNGHRNFSLWQANARGVDLNHNYDAAFDCCKEAERSQGIFSGGPTKYGGEYPESEPESAALVHFTRYLAPRLHLVMALHTQGEEIYYDFEGHTPKNGRMLADCFSKVSGYRVASPPKEASAGGYKDFVIREFDIPAFTVECGNGKNPLPPSELHGICQKVFPILLTAAAY